MEKIVTPRRYVVNSWHRGSKTFPEVSYNEQNSPVSIRHDDFEFSKIGGIQKMPSQATTLHDSPSDKFHVVPYPDGSGVALAHHDKISGKIRLHTIEKNPDPEGDRWNVKSETFKE